MNGFAVAGITFTVLIVVNDAVRQIEYDFLLVLRTRCQPLIKSQTFFLPQRVSSLTFHCASDAATTRWKVLRESTNPRESVFAPTLGTTCHTYYFVAR